MKTINVDSTVNEADLLDAQAAARALGVRKETLYAYVSRGLLKSYGGARSKGSRYLAADVLRLKARSAARAGHGAVAAGALRWGEPVLDSAISGVIGGTLVYRGRSAVTLAEDGVPFESVAELLWTGELPREPPIWTPLARPARSREERRGGEVVAHGPGDLFVALWSAVTSAARIDADRHGATAEAELVRARALIASLASLAALDAGRGDRSVAARLARGLGLAPTARTTRALDAMLVLMADHELNASTFAARVAASTGADLYGCVLAGLAAASGPKHGAAAARVEALIDEVADPSRARAAIDARTRRGEAVPGFGHPLYANGIDPRAPPLLALARRIAPRARSVRICDALCRAMERSRRERPNIDLALVAVAEALGAPRGSASLVFMIGRCAGWVAHALEQRAAGFLLRPRARYVGPTR